MTIAAILAGGTGSRMGADRPKQFLEIEGCTVIERSVDAFEQSVAIDEIAIVMHPDWMDEMRDIMSRNKWCKVRKLLSGGSERYMSSLNAIEAYLDYPDDTRLLLHDAARPWVSQKTINEVVEALGCNSAVGVAIPSTDTVWEVRPSFSGDGQSIVTRIPDRATMWLAQTPQGFHLQVIRDAYQRALQDPSFRATDDCGVVRRYMPEVKLAVVAGDVSNRKITYLGDLG